MLQDCNCQHPPAWCGRGCLPLNALSETRVDFLMSKGYLGSVQQNPRMVAHCWVLCTGVLHIMQRKKCWVFCSIRGFYSAGLRGSRCPSSRSVGTRRHKGRLWDKSENKSWGWVQSGDLPSSSGAHIQCWTLADMSWNPLLDVDIWVAWGQSFFPRVRITTVILMVPNSRSGEYLQQSGIREKRNMIFFINRR